MDAPSVSDDAKLAACDSLLRSAQHLLDEVERFGQHISKIYAEFYQKFPSRMTLTLAHSIRAEMESLQEAKSKHSTTDPLATSLTQSSNLPFLQAVWDTTKRCRNVVWLRCSVLPGPCEKQILAPGKRILLSMGETRGSRGPPYYVDVICDDGRKWYKVSTMTNKRLLYDMAKEAFGVGDSESEEDDQDPQALAESYADIPLLKLARKLLQSATCYRIHTTNPVPHIVLPRIIEGESAEVDKMLTLCRGLGVVVLTSNTLGPVPTLSDKLLHAMAPGPMSDMSDTLNIDTNVLVALTSDLCHMRVKPQPWFNETRNAHLEMEAKDTWVLHCYAMMGEHELVCTREAAQTFFHISETIGTKEEKERAGLILSPDPTKTADQRVAEFQALSLHPVPPGIRLPIRIIDKNENECQTRLAPPIAEKLQALIEPVRSVFSYGWASKKTTLTCNSVAIKQLQRDVETTPSLEGLEWPSMWVFASSRQLVGTPKNGGKRVRKHIGDCAGNENCTCGIQNLYGDQDDVTLV